MSGMFDASDPLYTYFHDNTYATIECGVALSIDDAGRVYIDGSDYPATALDAIELENAAGALMTLARMIHRSEARG